MYIYDLNELKTKINTVNNFLFDYELYEIENYNDYLMGHEIECGNFELYDDMEKFYYIVKRINNKKALNKDVINDILNNNELENLKSFIEYINNDSTIVSDYNEFILNVILNQYNDSIELQRFFFKYIDKDELITEKLIEKFIKGQEDYFYLDTFEKLVISYY